MARIAGGTERKVYPYLRMDDLRLDLLPKIRQMIRSKRADHPWLDLGDDDLLRSAVFVAHVHTTFEGAAQTADMAPLDSEILAVVSRYQPVRTAAIVAMSSSTERTVKRHLAALVKSGLLRVEGTTRDRRYRLP